MFARKQLRKGPIQNLQEMVCVYAECQLWWFFNNATVNAVDSYNSDWLLLPVVWASPIRRFPSDIVHGDRGKTTVTFKLPI